MKLLSATAIALVFVVGCVVVGRGGAAFVAPDESEVSKIIAYDWDSAGPDGRPPETTLPKAKHAELLQLLDGARRDRTPAKWEVLGRVEITTDDGLVEVNLFSTSKEVGAFRSGGKYYRGGSTAGFQRILDLADKPRTE